jgi:hypothetical protein
MRLNSQSSTFIFNFPVDFIPDFLYGDFQKLMEKDFNPYDTVLDYLNSTIKQITFPALTFEAKEQFLVRGKKRKYKESMSIYDKFSGEVDIQFRSVDSWSNYFMIQQILTTFYQNNQMHHLPLIILQILDKDGDLIYTVVFREIIFKGLSEIPLNYNAVEINEQTFSVQVMYNWIDIYWELDDNDERTSTNIFDIPIKFTPGTLDIRFGNVPYKQFNRGARPKIY